MSSKPIVIITGGGTGGHLYPALAIAQAVSDFAEVHYVGHPDKIEGKVVPERGIPFHGVRSLPGASTLAGRAKLGLRLGAGVAQCLGLVATHRPAVVIGVGGFVSVPMMLAAHLTRRPMLLHEQNVAPGKANRTLARICKMRVMTTFPVDERYFPDNEVEVTGCPVRPSFGTIDQAEARKILGLPERSRVVLLMGGSGGAAALNATGLGLLPLLDDHPDLHIVHATGRNYAESHADIVAGLPTAPGPRYRVHDYLDDSALFMAAADLIVSRSGASTISEVFCAGLPSILIPSPNVAEDHQTANAAFAVGEGAAIMVEETDDYVGRARQAVADLLGDPGRLQTMAERARANCRGKEAARNLSREVQAIIDRGR